MDYRSVFQRYELKYLITQMQKQELLQMAAPYLIADPYGRTTIRNVYYDTEDYRLIRRSIDKPVYKEKLRLRSYAQVEMDGPIFVELKKKYRDMVFKRRLQLPQTQALAWLRGDCPAPKDCQIAREIDYFLRFYGALQPRLYLSYDREAFYGREDMNFRVTFDQNITCRQEALTLDRAAYGTPILQEGMCLMEIKCAGGIPLWMTKLLSERRIYKTSFSKYGISYKEIIFPLQKERISYA